MLSELKNKDIDSLKAVVLCFLVNATILSKAKQTNEHISLGGDIFLVAGQHK